MIYLSGLDPATTGYLVRWLRAVLHDLEQPDTQVLQLGLDHETAPVLTAEGWPLAHTATGEHRLQLTWRSPRAIHAPAPERPPLETRGGGPPVETPRLRHSGACPRMVQAGGGPIPAPFEALRHYACQAIEQLLTELADQAVRYAVPADDVVALLRQVAEIRHTSVWDVYLDWTLRHAIPAHQLLERATAQPLAPEERAALRARLRDLFGYALLGLILTEQDSDDKNR